MLQGKYVEVKQMDFLKRLCRDESGAANVGGMILIAVSFIGLVVIIIMFPILITGIQTVTNQNLTNFTGLASVVNLTPLLAWVGAVVMTIVSGYMGVKKMKG
jgi:Flp pilus assembly pilin Flp